MRFYIPWQHFDEAEYELEESAFSARRLPHVHYPDCGHDVWWDQASVPIEIPAGSELWNLAWQFPNVTSVSPQQWEHVESLLRRVIIDDNRPIPWIFPGMRLGPLNAHLTYLGEPPDLVCTSAYDLYSERVVALFRERDITGFDVYPVQMTGSKTTYYELVPISIAPLAAESGYKETACSNCGQVSDTEYDGLIVDESSWDGGDVLSLTGIRTLLVSERVREAFVEIGGRGALFLPSEKFALGPDKKPADEQVFELIMDLKWSEQIKRARTHKR